MGAFVRRLRLSFGVVLAGLWGAAGAASAMEAGTGDPVRGGELWAQQCAMCHALSPAAEEGLGPHLADLIGRPVAGVEGYAGYSEALRALAGQGAVWDVERLRAFLRAPYREVPGTRMGFGGLDSASDTDHLIAFLTEAGPDASTAESGFRVPREVLAIEGETDWGEFLAAECSTCHRRDGSADGIPAITGWDTRSFVTVMHAYREKVRPNPTMQTIAARLSDEEIAALAAYFATLERAPH